MAIIDSEHDDFRRAHADGGGPRSGCVVDRRLKTAALVDKVLCGDMAAFATLYRSHVAAVAKAVRDNVHDPETVADVIQEVFARALERLGTLRDAERFRPWLLSIARNAAIDQRRSRARAPEGFDDHAPEPAEGGPGPADLAELNDLARLVQGCVVGLSKRDATALSLVTQLGLRPPEVAAALDVSVGAAKVILCRARQRLREALALELMVRRRAVGCEEFGAAFDMEDLVGAARHVRSCPVCAALVETEVSLYGTPR